MYTIYPYRRVVADVENRPSVFRLRIAVHIESGYMISNLQFAITSDSQVVELDGDFAESRLYLGENALDARYGAIELPHVILLKVHDRRDAYRLNPSYSGNH